MNKNTKLTILLLAAINLGAAGCASTSSERNDRALAGDFGDDSLEILFATEFPVASKEEALSKAALAYRDGEIDKSQFYLVRALKFDVADVDLLAQIGTLHALQGNTVLAARAFNFALQQNPEHARSLEGLGLLYFHAGNDERARDLLEKATSLEANLWRSHNVLGVIADRDSDYERASTHYDLALGVRPQSDSILINRGYSKFLNNLHLDAAMDFYAVATRSGNPKAWRNLGMVYARQGWYESSFEVFLEVLDPPAAHNEVGTIAIENGDLEAAWHHLNEAVRLSPKYFAAAEEKLAEIVRRDPRLAAGSFSGYERGLRRNP